MSRLNLENPNIYDAFHMMGFKLRGLVQTLGATFTIDRDMPPVLNLDPGGAGRNVVVPAVEESLTFFVNNIADAAEVLTIKAVDGTTTIGDIAQNEMGLVTCQGGVWYVRLVGTST